MTSLDRVPEDFDFDPDKLAGVTAGALRKEAPELFAQIDELRWFASIDDDGLPVVSITTQDGRQLARIWVDWREVGR